MIRTTDVYDCEGTVDVSSAMGVSRQSFIAGNMMFAGRSAFDHIAQGSFMKHPSIKLALIGIFALFAALFSATAYFSLSGINVLNDSTNNFATNVVPSISVAKDIQLARLQLRGGYEDHVLAITADQMTAAAAAIVTKERDLDAAV